MPNDQHAQKLVSNNVHACISGIVEKMFKTDCEEMADLAGGRLGGGYETCDACQGLGCDECESGEVFTEVYEYWIVSDWLAEKLSAKGEIVENDFWGPCVWGRQTSGQLIYADRVIEEIATELHQEKVS